jgi:hypothetical protein
MTRALPESPKRSERCPTLLDHSTHTTLSRPKAARAANSFGSQTNHCPRSGSFYIGSSELALTRLRGATSLSCAHYTMTNRRRFP